MESVEGSVGDEGRGWGTSRASKNDFLNVEGGRRGGGGCDGQGRTMLRSWGTGEGWVYPLAERGGGVAPHVKSKRRVD